MRSLLVCTCAAFFAVAFVLPARADDKVQPRQAEVKSVKVKGKVVKADVEALTIQTADNKEVMLSVSPQTRFMVDGKAARIADIRVGTEINAAYVVDRDRFVVNNVWVGAMPEEGEVVQGRIVRVVGDDQVVIMTPEKKEIIVYVSPQTTYTFDNRAVKFADLRQGTDVRVTYDLRNRRPIARAILGVPRP